VANERQSGPEMRAGRGHRGDFRRAYIRIPLQIFMPNLKRDGARDPSGGCLSVSLVIPELEPLDTNSPFSRPAHWEPD